MEIWKIDVNNDECQYQGGPVTTASDYRCSHPLSKNGGRCVTEKSCPVAASQPIVEAGRAGVCKHEKVIAIAHGYMCEKCRVVIEPPVP